MNIESANLSSLAPSLGTVDTIAQPLTGSGSVSDAFSGELVAQIGLLSNTKTADASPVQTPVNTGLPIINSLQGVAAVPVGNVETQNIAALLGNDLPSSYQINSHVDHEAVLGTVTDTLKYIGMSATTAEKAAAAEQNIKNVIAMAAPGGQPGKSAAAVGTPTGQNIKDTIAAAVLAGQQSSKDATAAAVLAGQSGKDAATAPVLAGKNGKDAAATVVPVGQSSKNTAAAALVGQNSKGETAAAVILVGQSHKDAAATAAVSAGQSNKNAAAAVLIGQSNKDAEAAVLVGQSNKDAAAAVLIGQSNKDAAAAVLVGQSNKDAAAAVLVGQGNKDAAAAVLVGQSNKNAAVAAAPVGQTGKNAATDVPVGQNSKDAIATAALAGQNRKHVFADIVPTEKNIKNAVAMAVQTGQSDKAGIEAVAMAVPSKQTIKDVIAAAVPAEKNSKDAMAMTASTASVKQTVQNPITTVAPTGQNNQDLPVTIVSPVQSANNTAATAVPLKQNPADVVAAEAEQDMSNMKEAIAAVVTAQMDMKPAKNDKSDKKQVEGEAQTAVAENTLVAEGGAAAMIIPAIIPAEPEKPVNNLASADSLKEDDLLSFIKPSTENAKPSQSTKAPDGALQNTTVFRQPVQDNQNFSLKSFDNAVNTGVTEKSARIEQQALSVEGEKALPRVGTDLAQPNKLVADTKADVPAITKPLSHPEWNKDLGERIVWMSSKAIPTAEIRLNPPHLGPISVRVDVADDQATVVFSAQHAATRDAIEASIPKLKEMMGAQQLNLADVNISQGSMSDQGRSQAQNFAQTADGRGQQGGAANVAANGVDEIEQEIESGRAVVSNGLLSIYA